MMLECQRSSEALNAVVRVDGGGKRISESEFLVQVYPKSGSPASAAPPLIGTSKRFPRTPSKVLLLGSTILVVSFSWISSIDTGLMWTSFEDRSGPEFFEIKQFFV
jgi:hypothetical protein